MSEWITSLVALIKEVPSPLAFIILVFCSMIEYIFPIFPGDTVILLGGFLSGVHPSMLAMSFLSTLIGTFLGSFIAYFIGRFIRVKGTTHPRLKGFFFDHHLFEKFQTWYHKYGWWMIVFNRFLSGIRAVLIIACGFFNLSLNKTLLLTLVSAIIYNTFLFSIGYFFGSRADMLLDAFFRYSLIFTIIIAVIAGSCFFYFMMKNNKKLK